jgi:hypothetical protein
MLRAALPCGFQEIKRSIIKRSTLSIDKVGLFSFRLYPIRLPEGVADIALTGEHTCRK